MEHFQTDLDLVAPDLSPWFSSRLFPDITGFLHELAIVHQHRSLQGFVIPRFEAHSQISYLTLARYRRWVTREVGEACHTSQMHRRISMFKISSLAQIKSEVLIIFQFYMQAAMMEIKLTLQQWLMVLGNFLNKRRDNELLNCGMSEADLQLDQLSDLLEDLRSSNTELLKGDKLILT